MGKKVKGDTVAAANAPVLVLGLGRFGFATAESLERLGHQVLAVDHDAEIVQRWADQLTHVVQADVTDEASLRQIGAEQFDIAVVGVGDHIEASVLTVMNLAEIGVREIWAKAINGKHQRILERIGANHVVRPESAMGKRVAHLVTGAMIDYMEFDDGFAIARTRAPEEAANKSLEESAMRGKYGITVVGIKRRHTDFTYARPETVVLASDELIVSGPTAKVEKFCAVTHH